MHYNKRKIAPVGVLVYENKTVVWHQRNNIVAVKAVIVIVVSIKLYDCLRSRNRLESSDGGPLLGHVQADSRTPRLFIDGEFIAGCDDSVGIIPQEHYLVIAWRQRPRHVASLYNTP
jgi:hypothetical protein